MLERLSEAEQIERYRVVRDRLWNPANAVRETRTIQPTGIDAEFDMLLEENETLKNTVTGQKSTITKLRHLNEELREQLALLEDTPVTCIEDCIRETAKYFGIPRAVLLSSARRKQIVRPRQIAMYLAHQHSGHTNTTIGNKFGGRDHSTVHFAVNAATEFLKTDEDLQKAVATISERLNLTEGA